MVEIDTTGGPGFGFEHFKSHDFLREGEVVLTFDDGPWPRNTPAVLAALAAHCTKAIFFPIGKHATYEPGILKQVAAAGHAVGSHTWSHQDLSKKSVQEGKDEIEKGMSAVRWAAGVPTAPYFASRAAAPAGARDLSRSTQRRDLLHRLRLVRFPLRKPEELRKAVMAKLKKHGKGIALMHDFQASPPAPPPICSTISRRAATIVFMKPKGTLATIACV